MENSFLISQPQGFNMLGQRGNQEDALFPSLDEATSARRLFMVCDGMGCHEHGEVASRCVAETIGTLASAVGECTVEVMRQTFEDALDEAYRRYLAFYSKTPSERYRDLIVRCPEDIIRLPFNELASYLSVSRRQFLRIRETVNRK